MNPETACVRTNQPDFSTITEIPCLRATREQVSMLHTRYYLAGQHAAGKDVLEVACGAGLGLQYLAKQARSVTGVDIDSSNVRLAVETHRHCAGVVVRQGDAQELGFPDQSFDLVLLYEAIYYLPDPRRFMAEARRVLRPGGKLIVVTVNARWSGFNPSPYSVHYPSVSELGALLEEAGFMVELQGGFRDCSDGVMPRMVSVVRRAAVALHLFPRTMKGKERLKRLFYGRLTELPAHVEVGAAHLERLKPLRSGDPWPPFKVFYATGTLPPA